MAARKPAIVRMAGWAGRLSAWGIAMMAIATIALSSAAAQQIAPAPEQIDAAIEEAVAYILKQRGPDGTWEQPVTPGPTVWGPPPGGRTAIALLGLVAAGRSPNDAELKPAIEALAKVRSTSIYVISVRAQLFSRLPRTELVMATLRSDLR
jgi:hypothetical protein